jgi:hypothetical protein
MTKASEIEFPCRYPIKVICRMDDGVATRVIETVRKHAPDVTPDDITTRASSGDKFVSVRINLMAQGPVQLKQMYDDLMTDAAVRMVI